MVVVVDQEDLVADDPVYTIKLRDTGVEVRNVSPHELRIPISQGQTVKDVRTQADKLKTQYEI